MKRAYSPLPDHIERLASEIVDSSFAVHREMGPGLLESVYEECLCRELEHRAIRFARQVNVPLRYRGRILSTRLRLDMLVEDSIIVELKCVQAFEPVHAAQLLSYLKLASKPLGFLLNFHVANIGYGIKRYIMSDSLLKTPDAQ